MAARVRWSITLVIGPEYSPRAARAPTWSGRACCGGWTGATPATTPEARARDGLRSVETARALNPELLTFDAFRRRVVAPAAAAAASR